MHKSVLSIDGGGTKTAALVADINGNVRALEPAKSCNPQDGPAWKGALRAIFKQASDIDFTVIGMPGFGEIPSHDIAVSEFITAEIGPKNLIINDVELAYRGAFPTQDGILILAGTGSMAIAGTKGVVHRVGGWGHVFGDEGSAFWIGQQALAHAAAEQDGRRPSTGFADRLADILHAPNHQFGLLEWAVKGDNSRAWIAGVARGVDDLSQTGSTVAASILEAAADQLTAFATAASPLALPWCHAGSVFKSRRIYDTVVRALGPPTPAESSALAGGLIHAAALAEWGVAPDWIKQVASHSETL